MSSSRNTAATVAKQDCLLNTEEQEIICPASIVLHKSDNAWRPSCERRHPLDEKEKFRRCVQGTLNKLTFQKFKILLVKIADLKFNKVEDLDLVIDLIFENAVYEPHFSILYANLCKELCRIQLCVVDSTGNHENFHEHLLEKSLKHFDDWCIKRKQEIQTVEVNNAEREKLQLLFDEEKNKLKRKQIGILRFMGELFNFCLIINPIIHECIDKLLTIEDDKSLEFACVLLKTVGKKLDRTEVEVHKNLSDENRVDVYFEKIQTVVDKRLTNTRIRFMLQDVLDLRKNNWIPRRFEVVPMTIDEIRNEAKLETSRSE